MYGIKCRTWHHDPSSNSDGSLCWNGRSMDWRLLDVNVGLQGGKTFRASFCASLITGLRWAFLFVECVCLSFCDSSDWDWMKYTRCDRLLLGNRFYLFLMLLLLMMMMSSSFENYFGFRTNVRVKTDDFFSLSWNVKNVLNKEVCIFLIIMHSICE